MTPGGAEAPVVVRGAATPEDIAVVLAVVQAVVAASSAGRAVNGPAQPAAGYAVWRAGRQAAVRRSTPRR